MKNYLLVAAVVVALVGCGRSSTNRMGSSATYQSENAAQPDVNVNAPPTNGYASPNGSDLKGLKATESGAAAGSLDSSVSETVNTPNVTADGTLTPQTSDANKPEEKSPENQPATDQAQPPQTDQSQPQPTEKETPQQPEQPDQSAVQPQSNTTGDQSNGDLSNRPQGAPGRSDIGAGSSDDNAPQKENTTKDANGNQDTDEKPLQ